MAEIEWTRRVLTECPEPLVRRLPYVECKLEHGGIEPTRYGDSFFPDAVPYEIDGTHRVFYWRPVLGSATGEWDDCGGVYATPETLSFVPATGSVAPDLVSRSSDGIEIVVDGTVAGDSTTTVVSSYAVPEIRIQELSDSRLELVAGGETYALQSGTRRRIALSDRTAEPVDGSGTPLSASPELVVRFPGERELHHPAPEAQYRLFPSFGLDLETVPNPLPVPTANGELDHTALATVLDIDLSDRPYPERALWQAFAYTAFDPHSAAVPTLRQFPSGHLALLSDSTADE